MIYTMYVNRHGACHMGANQQHGLQSLALTLPQAAGWPAHLAHCVPVVAARVDGHLVLLHDVQQLGAHLLGLLQALVLQGRERV